MFCLYSFLVKKPQNASLETTSPSCSKIPGPLVDRFFPHFLSAPIGLAFLLVVFLLFAFSPKVSAQIAGKTVLNGPFLVDNAEDMNSTAESLGRNWVSDFVKNKDVLSIIDLSSSGLTLHSNQSPLGAFMATVPADNFGTLSGGFGVPIPSVIGASTLDSPGNITSFIYLNFFECHEPASFPGMKFQVMIECYPGNSDGTFPTVFWNYVPIPGKVFGSASIDLRKHDGIQNNPASLSASALLSKTRYLYFYFFATPVASGNILTARIDDVQLSSESYLSPATATAGWSLYE